MFKQRENGDCDLSSHVPATCKQSHMVNLPDPQKYKIERVWPKSFQTPENSTGKWRSRAVGLCDPVWALIEGRQI